MPETFHAASVVIGAGVVGLAIARALAQAGLAPILIERHPHMGMETSSRNSEVIHAGLYYPPGSLKARSCVEGKALLYDYCASHHIAHHNCQKLIVATNDAQISALEDIQMRARANGVDDTVLLTRQEACALEPELSGVAALLSPSTGIIDSHAFMLALLGDITDAGGTMATHTTVTALHPTAHGYEILTKDDTGEAFCITSPVVINAAGLLASDVARTITGLDPCHIPHTRYARGVYFTLSGRAPFSRLIYPAPEPGGLGIHLTLDLAGQARFGPDVEWVETIDYTVDPTRAERFYSAIRTYWPALPESSLQPGYAGLRPKLTGPNDPAADFIISHEQDHGLKGLVNLYGIESPGLTAALNLAHRVTGLITA